MVSVSKANKNDKGQRSLRAYYVLPKDPIRVTSLKCHDLSTR